MATIRLATADDIPTLIAHRRGMWIDVGSYTDRELDAADPVYRRWLRPRLKSGELVAWIVEERGVVASSGKGPRGRRPSGRAPEDKPRRNAAAASGALWLQVVQPRPRYPSGVTPYLLSMYTAPAHRGQGHAKRIVRAATRWAKREGYPRMTLHASAMGRPVYEKLGWERTWEMALTLKQPARSRSRPSTRRG